MEKRIRKTLGAALFLGAAAALAVPPVAQAQERRSVGETIDDGLVTAKVKAALLADKDVKGLDVRVETRNGVVTLSGEVDSLAQSDIAARVTRQVAGVASVENRLTVRPAAAVPREGTKADADADSAFARYDANKDGRLDRDEFRRAYRELGPGERRVGRVIDDGLITAKVKAALVADKEVKALDVHVDTKDGRVVLSGEVNDPAQVAAAERIARGIEGVATVSNNLTVKK